MFLRLHRYFFFAGRDGRTYWRRKWDNVGSRLFVQHRYWKIDNKTEGPMSAYAVANETRRPTVMSIITLCLALLAEALTVYLIFLITTRRGAVGGDLSIFS